MAAERVSMRKVREILRLRWDLRLSGRETARSVVASPSTVTDCVQRAEVAGLKWPLAEEMDDARLEAMLYPPAPTVEVGRAEPDWSYVHKELRRKGVTLGLLWQEYKGSHPEDGYQYSRFCDLYREWRGGLDVVMRQQHRAGEKMLVDFSGDGLSILDRETGEVAKAELFVAVMAASGCTYAEVTPSQELRYWVMAHCHAYEFFGGVPEITVPDQTSTAVTRPCRYDPDLNATYAEMARYYNTAIIPARPRKPRDKAGVENGVLIAQRWILAALRNHTFFSVAEGDEAVRGKLEEYNGRKFQKLDCNRNDLFESVDRPALRPLPATRYEFAEWSSPRVNIDYHVEVMGARYSVPFQLVHEKVEARVTASTVEVFFKGRRVASHARLHRPGEFSTVREHMPKAHQQFLEWTPSRIIEWAKKTGPCTALLAERVMASRPHPQHGYRCCLGILRLGKRYGSDRLEAACTRALQVGALSYRSIESILKTGLDAQPLIPTQETAVGEAPGHENVRGSGYYM